ncbi:MAG: hypothetical protein NVV70_07775 [Cellulomonas sp.]|nr:hypothetical protein [Cellulomonas sp.]MCR6648026.1 hypothetical protein [Cellulomonas sp.]
MTSWARAADAQNAARAGVVPARPELAARERGDVEPVQRQGHVDVAHRLPGERLDPSHQLGVSTLARLDEPAAAPQGVPTRHVRGRMAARDGLADAVDLEVGGDHVRQDACRRDRRVVEERADLMLDAPRVGPVVVVVPGHELAVRDRERGVAREVRAAVDRLP